jgi:hypothetical protein
VPSETTDGKAHEELGVPCGEELHVLEKCGEVESIAPQLWGTSGVVLGFDRPLQGPSHQLTGVCSTHHRLGIL